jgi:hypothetical protein
MATLILMLGEVLNTAQDTLTPRNLKKLNCLLQILVVLTATRNSNWSRISIIGSENKSVSPFAGDRGQSNVIAGSVHMKLFLDSF